MCDQVCLTLCACSSSRADGSQGALSPHCPGGRHCGPAVSGIREAQAHHFVVTGGGEHRAGGRSSGPAPNARWHGGDGELRWHPEDCQRDPGPERDVPLPDKPVQRVQREAQGGADSAGGAVWVTRACAHTFTHTFTHTYITKIWKCVHLRRLMLCKDGQHTYMCLYHGAKTSVGPLVARCSIAPYQ